MTSPCEQCRKPDQLSFTTSKVAQFVTDQRQRNLDYWDSAVDLTLDETLSEQDRAVMSETTGIMTIAADNIVVTMEGALQEADATVCPENDSTECPKLLCIYAGLAAIRDDVRTTTEVAASSRRYFS